MTSPSAPSRGHKITAALYFAWLFAVYCYCWWHVFHLSHPINGWGAAVAVLGVIGIGSLVKGTLRSLIAYVVLVVLVNALGSDSFVNGFDAGLCGFAAFLGTVMLAAFVVGMFRGVRKIRLGRLDGEPAPEPGPRQIIGLSGYAGSGKDTAAAALLEDGWTRVSFADKLREFAYALDPYVAMEAAGQHDTHTRFVRLRALVDEVGWDRAKNENPDVRALLQRLGTDCGRELLGENVWVDAVMSALPDSNVVVTDTRFPNEAAAIKGLGGRVVRITRPGVGAVNGHKSDSALDGHPFDATLVNDADVLTLHKRMRRLAHGLKARGETMRCHSMIR